MDKINIRIERGTRIRFPIAPGGACMAMTGLKNPRVLLPAYSIMRMR